MMKINSIHVYVKYLLFTNLFNQFVERWRSRSVMTNYVCNIFHHPYVF